MENVTFGRTGFSVSRLGFGGAPIGYLKTEQERTEKILNYLLDHGVNVIDTAANYPGSELAIGQAIGHRRKEFVLISKCGTALPDVSGTAWSADLISAAVDRSLKNLRTNHLDVMLLHSCDLKALEQGEAIGALSKARQAGKIRFAGYSGDNEAAAFAAAHPDIAVVQTSVSIADQRNIRTVLPVAQKHNVGVIVKRPIANAAWKKLEDQQGLYQNYARTYHDRLKAMNLTPEALGFSGAPEQAWPEIAMRYTLSQAVHVAIIGTTNPDNAAANIANAEKGPLSPDVVKKIESAFAAVDPEGKWMGQT